MKSIFPEPLKTGDEIRIIAPSRSMDLISDYVMNLALERLKKMGFTVSFGRNIYNSQPHYGSATIIQRVNDLHEAFLDKKVKGILSLVGGYNANQLLQSIDFNIILENPKVFCGLSDITVLQNPIFSKTGLVTFSGPHFVNFGMKYGFDYTQFYFEKALMQAQNYYITSAEQISKDEWYNCQEARTFITSTPMHAIAGGTATGTIIGGHLSTFCLLRGTKYMPSLAGKILFLEDNYKENFLSQFCRNFTALVQTDCFENIAGLVIGKQIVSEDYSDDEWRKLFYNAKISDNIPIIIDTNIGHTTPIFTFPIGGNCKIDATNHSCSIEIILAENETVFTVAKSKDNV